MSNQFAQKDQQQAAKKELAVVSTKELAKLPGYKMAWAEIKMMITNGVKLSDIEAHTLATFALVNNLNPTTGECYLLKDESKDKVLGPVVGIKGFRRKAQEQLGPDENYFTTFRDGTPEPGEDYRIICELRDTKSMMKYLTLRKMAEEMARENKEADAVKAAKDLVGEPPVWIGIGTFNTSERNDWKDKKYHPYKKTKKRAEADAIRQRFNFSYKLGESMYEQMEDSQVDGEDPNTVDVEGNDLGPAEGPGEEIVKQIQFENEAPDITPDPELEKEDPKYARPMIPAAIKDLVGRAKQNGLLLEVKTSKTARPTARAILDSISKEAEEATLEYLFKKKTVDELNDAEIHGLMAWIAEGAANHEGETRPTNIVSTEVQDIIASRRK